MSQTKTVIPFLLRRQTVLLCFSLLMLSAVSFCSAQIDQTSMILNAKLNVDAVGNAHLDATIKFNPPRIYDRVKAAYPNLYVLFRDMIANDRANTEIDRATTKITADDGTQTISFSANEISGAVCRNGTWQITMEKGESLVTNEGSRVITSLVSTTSNGMLMNGTGIYNLPAGARNVSVDKENHLLMYSLPTPPVSKSKPVGEPNVNLAVHFRKNVMSALYKIYADSEVANGRYWVAKSVVKNTGTAPMRDVKFTYSMGEYADTYTSRAYSIIPAHGAVVDCYYPIFSSKVAALKTRTPMQLTVKVEYKDAAGKTHIEDRSERLSMLGINQFEFSNLTEEEKTDSWFDKNNNGPLLAAYVTKIDDPVKQLAGYISEAAGGVAAAGKPEDAVKWLRAAYNMELMNNIVYQTPSSGDFSQDIKYPRDVLRAKSGTCVDLAILYAALAESVGLKTYLMLVPGHCFSVVSIGGGQSIAVENTGLGGGNQRMSFDQSVQTAQKEMQDYMQKGLYFLIDVDEQQGVGHVPNPELPALDANFLTVCGISRTGVMTETRPNRQPAPAPNRGDGGNNPDIAGGPKAPVLPSEDAKDFSGVWKGDIDGMNMTLILNQNNKLADGSITITTNSTIRGTFKKASVTEEGAIKLHIRATGPDITKSYSLSLEGKRDGNTIKGNGTLVVRGPLNVPIETRNVTWVLHYAGAR